MDLSAENTPKKTLTPFQENIRRLAVEVVNAHRHCDVGNPQKCDLYYNLIEVMQDLAFEVVRGERALMICGHPTACQGGNVCSVCVREARLIAEARNLPSKSSV